MIDSVDCVLRWLESGEGVHLVTVVGPEQAPASVLGRKMVIGPDGSVQGTLGAQSLDRRALDAVEQIGIGTPKRIPILLSPEECKSLGLAVGSELELFLDSLTPAPSLVIVGAGHIAQPLCSMGSALGFRVTVVDDRPSFASRERFPEAAELRVGYFRDELARLPLHRSTYVVIVTRGHAHDEEALRAVIDSEAAYIGMIGSRRKVRTILDRLAESGISNQRLGSVYSPIGLDIGAESPAEIAVSILAEMVAVRRKGGRHPSSMSGLLAHSQLRGSTT